VLGTYTAAGYSPGPFWAAPLCGTTLALGIGVLFVFLMHGDEQRAVALATAKTGSGYHYFVTHLSSTGNQGAAEVLSTRLAQKAPNGTTSFSSDAKVPRKFLTIRAEMVGRVGIEPTTN
jgi:hypothetical protein